MSIPMNIEPLAKAVRRLEEGLDRYRQDVSDIQIRDGLVQRFEFTYELSHKMLKRYLELTSPNPAIFDQMGFADLVRSGNEQGLLSGDWPVWKNFREMRGSTSHAYDETIAMKVVSGIPEFLQEANFLLGQLQARSHEQ
jgi:nucleotidyltransferase substrate binding protein (TIGR01987 family)